MLLMGLQKNVSEIDDFTSYLDSMGINVCNIFEGGNIKPDIWNMKDSECEQYFINHRYIIMLASKELFMSTKALYYLELAKKLYEKGVIKVFVVDFMIDNYMPKRVQWISETNFICKDIYRNNDDKPIKDDEYILSKVYMCEEEGKPSAEDVCESESARIYAFATEIVFEITDDIFNNACI